VIGLYNNAEERVKTIREENIPIFNNWLALFSLIQAGWRHPRVLVAAKRIIASTIRIPPR